MKLPVIWSEGHAKCFQTIIHVFIRITPRENPEDERHGDEEMKYLGSENCDEVLKHG